MTWKKQLLMRIIPSQGKNFGKKRKNSGKKEKFLTVFVRSSVITCCLKNLNLTHNLEAPCER